ncbi:MAG: serine/threonine-protein kinase [Polyangiaceae bacterium]
MNLARGQVLDAFTLLAPIAAGGQGCVWHAAHRVTGAPVALKLAPLTRDEASNERLRREARALARLEHPSLLRCLALFEDPLQNLIGVALEWIAGRSLADPAALRRLHAGARQLAIVHVTRALAHLHGFGIVHRDVKPANVLVDERFYASPHEPSLLKLGDLGIATLIGNPSPLTTAGVRVGTPWYMPPEALDPRAPPGASPRQDLFSLGVLGWELLFDAHPAGVGDDANTDELAAIYADYAALPEAWLPPSDRDTHLVAMLKRCLRIRPLERFDDARAALAALA